MAVVGGEVGRGPAIVVFLPGVGTGLRGAG